MARRTARCLCGELTATCAGEPDSVSLCHCIACQRRTGSTYGIAAFFRETCVEIAGEHRDYTRPSDSGHLVTFHFCPRCGSILFWHPDRKPGIVAIAVGAFGDPSFPPPTKGFYQEHRHSWVVP